MSEDNTFTNIQFNGRAIVESWLKKHPEAQDMGFFALRELEDLIQTELRKTQFNDQNS